MWNLWSCAGGGIGRHGSLRGCWEQSYAGSSPVPRTNFAKGEIDPERAIKFDEQENFM